MRVKLVVEILDRNLTEPAFVAVDDFQVLLGACRGVSECHFEDGLCHWEQDRRGDDFDWTVTNGEYLGSDAAVGPQLDHTKETALGQLALEIYCPPLATSSLNP